ncbi:MAG: hypothetical protein COB78_05670 [Hyphomicrobiales bacterium]|nr:MAG: hypothetical protein COB78_05670 [Hyphomicrobiales bacterium]
MDDETAGNLRGMIRRGNLKNFKDDGETQTASIEIAEGIWRDDVEVMQPYGFASHVPEDGALGVVLAIGGDEGDMVILPIANPSKRLGELKPGEVGFYNEHGDKAIMTAGGSLDISTGATVNITTDTGVTITAVITKVVGDFVCTGDVSDKNGSMQEMRDKYNVHAHPAGPPPNPQQD